METFKLLPIDWQAIGAMATFLAVVVAFYGSYQYRRREKIFEKREILERVIRPLEENVNSLLSSSGLSSPYFSNWNLKWRTIQKGNPYLIFKLPTNLKHVLDDFDTELHKFSNLTNQKLPKLKKVIADIVMRKLALLVGDDYAIQSYYHGKIGGKYFSVSFLNLLLGQKNLDEYLEKLKGDLTLPNTQIEEAQFIVAGFDKKFTKEIFDKVFLEVKFSVESDEELKNYIKSWISIINGAKRLAAEIKKYET